MYWSICLVVALFLTCASSTASAQGERSKIEPGNTRVLPRSSGTSDSTVSEIETARKSYKEGMELFDSGQLPAAAEKFRAAILADPEFADAYSALGRTYFKLREWQLAINNLRYATQLNAKTRNANGTVVKTEDEPTSRSQTSNVPPATSDSNSRAKKSVTPNLDGGGAAQQIKSNVVQSPTPKNVNDSPQNQSQTLKQPEASASAPPKNSAALKPTPIQSPNVSTGDSLKTVGPKSSPEFQMKLTADVRPLMPSPSKVITPIASGDVTWAPFVSLKAVQPEFTETVFKTEPPPIPDQSAIGTRVSQPVTAVNTKETPVVVETSPTRIYRVGPNDVLDVRINNAPSARSTLYTVTPTGLLEHPLLSDPMLVSGLTVEEITEKIEKNLIARAIAENPKAIVGVRDYASHSVLVSGLVKEAGTKYLKREGIPLYVVIADAQPLPEAAKVTLIRLDNQIFEMDLNQPEEMNFLVRSGDVITIGPHVTQFVYIGGEIKIPGEKTFRRGLTLLQVILASGGLSEKAKWAEIARTAENGVLVPTRFKLKDIVSGSAIDPLLKPGDRISVLR